MCLECWEEYGIKPIINDKIIEGVKLISAVYEFSSNGGNLHVHLEDWNLHLFDSDKELEILGKIPHRSQ